MAKFKVGDKVILKSGLKIGAKYNGLALLDTMPFIGIKTINEVTATGNYLIKINDLCSFFYAEEMLEPVNTDNIKPTFEVGDLVTLLKVDELPADFRYYPNKSVRNKYGGSIFVIKEVNKNEVIGHTNEDGYEYKIELLKTNVKTEDDTTSIWGINGAWFLPSGLKMFSKSASIAVTDVIKQDTSYMDNLNLYLGVDLASNETDMTYYQKFIDSTSIPIDAFLERKDSDKLKLHLNVRKKPMINFDN